MTKRAVFIGLALTGAVVGVGFASGKEIQSFFARFGNFAYLLCLVAGVLFFALCYLVLALYGHQEAQVFNEINAFKKRKINQKQVKNGFKTAKRANISITESVFSVVLFLCQISICSAMFAGVGSIFVSAGLGQFAVLAKLLLFVVALVATRYREVVYMINVGLSILMTAMIILLVCLFRGGARGAGGVSLGWQGFVWPVLYVGMNIFTIFPLLTEQAQSLKRRGERVKVSLAFSLVLTIELLVVCHILRKLPAGLVAADMPLLGAAGEVSYWFGYAYLLVMVLSVTTTCVSTAYGASGLLGQGAKAGKLVVCLLLSFALSFIGFAKIIDKVYPLLGALCVVMVLLKMILAAKKRKNCNSKLKNGLKTAK